MQEINRKYPKTNSKLSGNICAFLRQLPTNATKSSLSLRKEVNNSFALHLKILNPKIVIKGLLISTDIDDIKRPLRPRLPCLRLLSSLNLSQNSSSPSSWWNYKITRFPRHLQTGQVLLSNSKN
ncbi:hypothetical protein TNCV_3578921 [Trichonephila clavipes]|nr:hypothetical protein TNCV_3578921 [Trichonephila clavipes]